MDGVLKVDRAGEPRSSPQLVWWVGPAGLVWTVRNPPLGYELGDPAGQVLFIGNVMGRAWVLGSKLGLCVTLSNFNLRDSLQANENAGRALDASMSGSYCHVYYMREAWTSRLLRVL